MNKFKVNNFRLIFNVVLIISLLLGCKDKEVSIASIIDYENNYNIHVKNDSTLYVDYYDKNNKPFKHVNYKLNKEGKLLRDGEYIEFFSNGEIELKGRFNNDLRQGYWYYYSEKGDLKKIDMYIIDSIYHFGEVLNQTISFDSNLNIDNQKILSYYRINAFQDTIYNTEPFLFTVSLYNHKFQDGMYITIGDYDEYYRLNSNTKIDTIKTNAFEKTISIKNHKIGLNTIRGIIHNYDSINMKIWPHFFSVNYYVKK